MLVEPEFIEVVTTTVSEEEAMLIANALVKQRLAACVQVEGPVVSIYRWKENVEQDSEWRCLIKTSRKKFDEVAAAIRELHPYETPQIIALPIVDATDDYAAWMRKNT